MSTVVGVLEHVSEFTGYLRTQKNYSPLTIKSYHRDICLLSTHITSLSELTSSKLQTIVMKLNASGKSAATIKRFVSSVRSYMKYLEAHHHQPEVLFDIVLPKGEKKLPKTLSYEEVKALIDARFGYAEELRDVAMIACLYSAALRVSELVALNIVDIDATKEFIKVWGKGAKHRFTPISSVPLTLVEQYLSERTHHHEAVFLSARGKRISIRAVQDILKKRAALCGFDFNVHPHMLRHSAASHFLQSSSSIRTTQDYLGHKHITSTQVYTHLDIMNIAQVYDNAHPHSTVQHRSTPPNTANDKANDKT